MRISELKKLVEAYFKHLDQSILNKFEQAWNQLQTIKLPTTKQKTLLGNILNTKAFSIDGDYIKNNYSMDFVEGGHDLVYDYVPNSEIWVDANINHNDFKFVLYHEFVERTLMDLKQLQYEDAHNIANYLEHEKRKSTKF